MVLASLQSIETRFTFTASYSAFLCLLCTFSDYITYYSFSGCLESRMYVTLKIALLIPAKQVHDPDTLMLPAQARTCSCRVTVTSSLRALTLRKYLLTDTFKNQGTTSTAFPRLVFPLPNGSHIHKMKPLMGRSCIQDRHPFVPVQSILTSL